MKKSRVARKASAATRSTVFTQAVDVFRQLPLLEPGELYPDEFNQAKRNFSRWSRNKLQSETALAMIAKLIYMQLILFKWVATEFESSREGANSRSKQKSQTAK